MLSYRMASITLTSFFPGFIRDGNLKPCAPPDPAIETLDQVEPRIPMPSLPFTIDTPGIYCLTGDLT